jgi:hypothetical protein
MWPTAKEATQISCRVQDCATVINEDFGYFSRFLIVCMALAINFDARNLIRKA